MHLVSALMLATGRGLCRLNRQAVPVVAWEPAYQLARLFVHRQDVDKVKVISGRLLPTGGMYDIRAWGELIHSG